MSKRAEQKALEAYPDTYTKYRKEGDPEGVESGICTIPDTHYLERISFIKGYEQSEEDFVALVKQYLEKGEGCMEQEGESQIYTFWDGFHNCAENILRELEERNEKQNT